MSAPTDLRYTRDHEWVRVDGDEATVGITQYAADQLGDIVFVELPDTGRALEEAKPFGVVESVKAVSDLFAPLSGEVDRDQRRPGRPTPSSSTATRTARAGCSSCGSPTRPSSTTCSTATRTTTSSRPAERVDAVRTTHERRPPADADGARHR